MFIDVLKEKLSSFLKPAEKEYAATVEKRITDALEKFRSERKSFEDVSFYNARTKAFLSWDTVQTFTDFDVHKNSYPSELTSRIATYNDKQRAEELARPIYPNSDVDTVLAVSNEGYRLSGWRLIKKLDVATFNIDAKKIRAYAEAAASQAIADLLKKLTGKLDFLDGMPFEMKVSQIRMGGAPECRIDVTTKERPAFHITLRLKDCYRADTGTSYVQWPLTFHGVKGHNSEKAIRGLYEPAVK